ncbi:hypothetical protein KBD45_02340 [Candidatus Dojkabacteria bacterium]|nr:hypothetical protein [Candidatus Dojkabacteria bacterium]
MQAGHSFCESCPLKKYCHDSLTPEKYDEKKGVYIALPARTLGRQYMHTLCRHFTCEDNGKESAVQQLNLMPKGDKIDFPVVLNYGRRIKLEGRLFHSSDKPNDDRFVDAEGYIFSQVDIQNPLSEFAYTGRKVDKRGKIYIEEFPQNIFASVGNEIQRVVYDGAERNSYLKDILQRLVKIYQFSRSYSEEVRKNMLCVIFDESSQLRQVPGEKPSKSRPIPACGSCYFNSGQSRIGCSIIDNSKY